MNFIVKILNNKTNIGVDDIRLILTSSNHFQEGDILVYNENYPGYIEKNNSTFKIEIMNPPINMYSYKSYRNELFEVLTTEGSFYSFAIKEIQKLDFEKTKSDKTITAKIKYIEINMRSPVKGEPILNVRLPMTNETNSLIINNKFYNLDLIRSYLDKEVILEESEEYDYIIKDTQIGLMKDWIYDLKIGQNIKPGDIVELIKKEKPEMVYYEKVFEVGDDYVVTWMMINDDRVKVIHYFEQWNIKVIYSHN